ncbi:MAG: hypothetical protein QHJ73_13820 [Armatimonadota bacterium]|nr:hypothetical protein [Armatimonadota bacterium]
MTRFEVGSEGTRYVRLTIAVWYDQEDRSIHITAPGHRQFHARISASPQSTAGHPTLYRQLQEVLRTAGRWPPEAE